MQNKEKGKKIKKNRSWHCHSLVGEIGWNDQTIRVKIGNVMTCVNLCIYISRDMDTGRVENSPLML